MASDCLPSQALACASTPTGGSSNQNLSWRFITYSKHHTVMICPDQQVDKTNASLIHMHTHKQTDFILMDRSNSVIHHHIAPSPGSNIEILYIQLARCCHKNHKTITTHFSVVFSQPLTPKCQWSPIASHPFIQLNTVEPYHKLMKSRPSEPNSVSVPPF